MKSDAPEVYYDPLYDHGEKIKPDAVGSFGYRFTARFIFIGEKYKLFELLPLRSDQPAKVCFLALNGFKLQGVIIRDAFHEHKAMLTAMKIAQDKNLDPLPVSIPRVKVRSDENGSDQGGLLARYEREAAALYQRSVD